MSESRIERDLLGESELPAGALRGIHTPGMEATPRRLAEHVVHKVRDGERDIFL